MEKEKKRNGRRRYVLRVPGLALEDDDGHGDPVAVDVAAAHRRPHLRQPNPPPALHALFQRRRAHQRIDDADAEKGVRETTTAAASLRLRPRPHSATPPKNGLIPSAFQISSWLTVKISLPLIDQLFLILELGYLSVIFSFGILRVS